MREEVAPRCYTRASLRLSRRSGIPRRHAEAAITEEPRNAPIWRAAGGRARSRRFAAPTGPSLRAPSAPPAARRRVPPWRCAPGSLQPTFAWRCSGQGFPRVTKRRLQRGGRGGHRGAMPNDRQPGDLFLDRHLPDADDTTREEAREILRRYTLHLIAIGARIRREQHAAEDSTDVDRRPTISASPDL